jgi:hypothetical protein
MQLVDRRRIWSAILRRDVVVRGELLNEDMVATVFRCYGYCITVQVVSWRRGEGVAADEGLISRIIIEKVFDQSGSGFACILLESLRRLYISECPYLAGATALALDVRHPLGRPDRPDRAPTIWQPV